MTTATHGTTSATGLPLPGGTGARYPVPVRREVSLMRAEWDLVDTVERGTMSVRDAKETYLPRFPSEHIDDYTARVKMTFVENHYLRALDELVGLAFTKSPELDDDVLEPVVAMMENVTGEGEHLDVFTARALWMALHYGHAAILTDFPRTTRDDGTRMSERDVRDRAVRPYARLIPAKDILSWEFTGFGGVDVLTRIAWTETYDKDGATQEQVREMRQDVVYDDMTGLALALGTITYTMWRMETAGEGGKAEWVPKDEGTLEGPERIPFRPFHAGKRYAPLHTRPMCADLAYTNVELTQVASDRANVMHKCNVPTPWFVGLRLKQGEKLNMSDGVMLDDGGSAGVLEPSGSALDATAKRMEELRAEMRRQGAALPDKAGLAMTATEAALYAKQRNARLGQAVRALQDALEGMLSDFAAFMKLPEGGSITLSREFSANTFDVGYLTFLKDLAVAGIIPGDAVLHAAQHGRLPDDFDPMEAALKAMAAMEAERAAAAQMAEAEAAKAQAMAEANGTATPVGDDDDSAGDNNPLGD